MGLSALTGGAFSCGTCLTVPVDEEFELGGVWVHVDLALILSYAWSYFLSTVDFTPRPKSDSEDAGVGGGVCGFERPRSRQTAVVITKGLIGARRRGVEIT